MSGWAWSLFCVGMVGAFVGPWMMRRRSADERRLDESWARLERSVEHLRRERDTFVEMFAVQSEAMKRLRAENAALGDEVCALESEARLPRIHRRNRRSRGTVRP